MECKAITLLKQICDFAVLWNPGTASSRNITISYDSPRFLKDLDAVSKKSYYDDLLRKSRVIDKFHDTIAPITLGGSPESNAQLLVVHTCIHLATIRLGIFDSWKGKRLESALAVASMLDGVDISNIGYIHPVVGVSHAPTKTLCNAESSPLETPDDCRARAFGRVEEFHR